MSGFTPVFSPALYGTFAALCGSLLAPVAMAADTGHEGHEAELSPTVITAIAPSSPLTVVTNPKDPRQPVPASDGAEACSSRWSFGACFTVAYRFHIISTKPKR